MTKLPEPKAIAIWGNGVGSVVGYTPEQMLQFRRDTLEDAAKEAERMTMYPGGLQEAPLHDTVWHAARAIRKLKETNVLTL